MNLTDPVADAVDRLSPAAIDSLVDGLLKCSPHAGPEPKPVEESIAPEDREHLNRLCTELLSQYLDPIAQFIQLLRFSERHSETLASFQNLLFPVLQLTQTLQAEPQLRIIRDLLGHLDQLSGHRGVFTYRQLEPLRELFDQLLCSLDPEVRQRYIATCYYQRNSNPLLEEIRRVRYIGPRRLQRLYSVGLVTVDSISRATAREITEISGLPLRLSQQVIDATRTFVVQQRTGRRERLHRLIQDLHDELNGLTEKDGDILTGLRPHLDRLLPAVQRVQPWLDQEQGRPQGAASPSGARKISPEEVPHE